MVSTTLFASEKDDWETPQWLFDELDKEFGFNLDVAANCHNAKCQNYYDIESDGLIQPWKGVCWCNPPYGRNVGKWVMKAHMAAMRGITTVMLLPARTDTRYFHDYIYGRYEIRFLKGRLKFEGAKNTAPFPSMIVVFAINGMEVSP